MENGTNTGKFSNRIFVFYVAEISFALLFWSIDLTSKNPFRYIFILV